MERGVEAVELLERVSPLPPMMSAAKADSASLLPVRAWVGRR